MILTIEQAQQRCLYWQGVLRLQDWDIEVRIVRKSDLPNGLGSATIDTYKRARVKLLDPVDFSDAEWPIDRDMEATLLHELVHLHLEDLRVPEKDDKDRRTAEYVALERATEYLARALVALERARG